MKKYTNWSVRGNIKWTDESQIKVVFEPKQNGKFKLIKPPLPHCSGDHSMPPQ